MRLTCPNCGAQYEVPPEAIPASGRDVQCSACGRTWFEKAAAPPAEEPWDLIPRVLGDVEEEDDLAEAAAPAAPPRSTVTPEVADILREEAERESKARAAEAARRPPPLPPEEPVVRTARPLPEPSQPRPARAMDIAEINASLRTANDRIAGKAPQVGPRRRRRGGFARGFWSALAAVAVLAALYAATPWITDAAPELGVVLNPYAALVDRGRAWVDDTAQATRLAIEALQG